MNDKDKPLVTIDLIFTAISSYIKQPDLSQIKKAYDLAEKSHAGQVRKSGEPYIIHPLSVAQILTELHLDEVTIEAALLHDVVEDTCVTLEQITSEFGPEVSLLVDGVTKITILNRQNEERGRLKEAAQLETYRKMIIAMAKDIRVIMIKLADRLHNMRTLKYMPSDKQKRIARETLEIYAPIANRLGISNIKWELEDLSLRYLEPDVYYDLAGVAFKLCQALAQKIWHINFEEYTTDIEIAAMATVADLVPLIGENRKIVRIGLKEMSDSKCLGLNALVRVAGLQNKTISSSSVAFQIAPRLNSIGRLESASIGAKLLMSEDEFEAAEIAARLEEKNIERKRIERQIFIQAEEKVQILRDEVGGDLWTITIYDRRWNPGIIGLTASKLVEKYNLPAVVISEGENISRGSCRSIPALNVKEALDSMAELFENYGGHKQAAGFSLRTSRVGEFKRRFEEYVRLKVRDEAYQREVWVEAEVEPRFVEVREIEPCGEGNPEPIFLSRNVRCSGVRIMDRHVKFEIGEMQAVAFGAAAMARLIEFSPIDIVYRIGEWNGQSQVVVKEIAPPREGNAISRDLLIAFYKFLKAYRKKSRSFDCYSLAADFNEKTGASVSLHTIMTAIDVFSELGLIRFSDENRFFDMPVVGKRNLSNSRTFRLNGN